MKSVMARAEVYGLNTYGWQSGQVTESQGQTDEALGFVQSEWR
jgi:hypothetical protein